MRRELRRRRWAGAGRFVASAYPVVIAGGFMDQTDVPWFFHPFLIVFGAVLPLAAIDVLATWAANLIADRRARRLARPRPRLAYLWMTLGWALAAAAFRLLGQAAGGGPDGSGDWIVTGLGWSFMISVCAALMMAGRALTAGNGRRPASFDEITDADRTGYPGTTRVLRWVRDTACAEDASTGYAGNGPQVMAALRNLAISLLYLAGAREITRTLQAITRDRNRILGYLPL